jgi:hypothetical protein
VHVGRRERERDRAGRTTRLVTTDVEGELRAAAEIHAARVRRLRVNLVAWGIGTARCACAPGGRPPRRRSTVRRTG